MDKRLRKAYEQWLTTDDEIKTYEELEELFLEELNDTTVTICGHEYSSGEILKEIDHIAFREALNDWLDASYWSEIDGGGIIMYAREDDDPEERFLEEMCFECDECWENYLYEDLKEHDGRSLCPSCHAWLMEDEGEE